jgi:hypothetical protein
MDHLLRNYQMENMKTLDEFRRNVHSQNGEDGIIEEILKRTGLSAGTCVEFGAWDGKHLSNTYNLVQQGWKSVYIEGDPEKFQDLLKTQHEYPNRIQAVCAFVNHRGENTLDKILSKSNVERDYHLLSIDIDSWDWQIWESSREFTPKIVVIEINSALKPGIKQIHQKDGPSGSSFSSTLELGIKKGYKLVCHTGNMIFVRNDLIEKIHLSQVELDFPEILFDYTWFNYSPKSKRIAAKIRRMLRVE